MTADDLKKSLSELLSEEEEYAAADWDRVQDLSIALLGELRANETFEFPVELVIPYLTGFSMRREDELEAERQHAMLAAYLREQ
jgi:hypothetical protein